MSVIKLNEQTEIYLTNSLGEETGHKEIEKNTYEWYGKSYIHNGWLQYLVELNGVVGILAIQEFQHPDCDDWDSDKEYHSEAWRNSTGQDIWKHVEDIAQKMDEQMDFDVIVGKETGLMARHEVCIWIPFPTDKKIIEENYQRIKDIPLFY